MRSPEALAVTLALALAAIPSGARGADASVVLRWKPVADAVEYELEIGADPELGRVVLRERVPTPGFRWRTLPDERRWWRVRGLDGRGRPGRWSEVKTLEPVLRAPEPRAPGDGEAVQGGAEVELACAPSPPADAYELEVATDASFAAVVERRNGREPRFRLALAAGAYHWRMRGSVDGQTTPWSIPRRLSVAEIPEPPPPPPAESPAPAAAAVGTPADPAAPASPPAAEAGAAAATAAAEPPPAPQAAPEPPPAEPVAAAAAPEPERGRIRAGARLGWHTTFGGISTLSPGVEAEWRLPWREGLSISARLEYYGVSSTIPPMPGLATTVRASAQVVPVGAALVWARPYGALALYAGAGAQAQLVHTAVTAQERLDLVPGVLLLAGAGRRLGRGEIFAEASWATGMLENDLARFRTGGFQLAAGFRGAP